MWTERDQNNLATAFDSFGKGKGLRFGAGHPAILSKMYDREHHTTTS
jgi:hypothetical protein